MKHPKRLESLLEMLQNYARAFAVVVADVEQARAQVVMEAFNKNLAALPPDNPVIQRLKSNVLTALGTCQQVPQVARLIPPIGRLLAALEGEANISVLSAYIENLQLQIFAELDLLKLLHVEERLVEFYEAEMPFGEVVFDRFPSAVLDTRNAGRCLAVGQPTACMFHLMRVVERGLTAYAASLGIPYAPSWESYFRQLEKEFNVDWDKKAKAWKKIEPFHKQIVGDLVAVKTAWRNPTVHIVNDYDNEEAERAYHAVRGLMQNLSKKVGETSRRAKKKVAAA